MSPQEDKRRTEELLRSLLQSDALIIRQAIEGDWPAHIRGDLRKRPLFWVNSADVERLISEGLLEIKSKGVGLTSATRRRLKFGVSAREIVETTTYIPDGVERPVRRNVRGTTIERLSRRRCRKGMKLLTDAQITAAHRYTVDLARSGEGQVATRNYIQPKVDGATRHDAVENSALARLDGTRSLQAAREALGADLSRVLTAVCGADERLDEIERAENWSRGTGLAILRLGLDRLVIHYGTVPGQLHDCQVRKSA